MDDFVVGREKNFGFMIFDYDPWFWSYHWLICFSLFLLKSLIGLGSSHGYILTSNSNNKVFNRFRSVVVVVP